MIETLHQFVSHYSCNINFMLILQPLTATHMQSTSGNHTWCPGPSLWSLIIEHVPRSEMPKIHATLGCSLVDMYTELHAEVKGISFFLFLFIYFFYNDILKAQTLRQSRILIC